MLKVLRHKHVAKVIFWGLLILILPAFVLWGVGNIGSGKPKGPSFVGKIDGRKISFDDLGMSIMSVRSQLIMNYFNQPETLNSMLNNKPFMAKLGWDRLIMASEAKKAGIKISDKEVIQTITNLPIFLRGGSFDDKVYQYVIRNNLGMSPRSFEELVRQNLAIQKLNESISKDIKPLEEDIIAEFVKENGKYKISYIFFGLADKMDKVSITDEAVKDYYEKNKASIAIKPKDAPEGAPARAAAFDEVKDEIKKFLAEGEARRLVFESSVETYKKFTDLMAGDKLSFEDAAAKLGLKVTESPFIASDEKIEEIGATPMLGEALSMMKPQEVSKLIPAQNGIILVKLVEIDKVDREKFDKAKDELGKKAAEVKKNRYLDAWLRDKEMKTSLNINFNDYEKYFK